MADSPPKPKPMSLKDRIKQFEQPTASSSVPPPPRPKPGALSQWKPKPVEPPSPKQATPTADAQTEEDGQGGGMSASDAMSSITRGGGTLKERMAALQGKGAFGSSDAGSAPPLPSHEGKPRVWKASPAPPIEPKKADTGLNVENIRYDPSAPSSALDAPLSAGDSEKNRSVTGGEEDQSGNPPDDGEESERERRAAIAARMARIGGARLGMPIGFGVAAKSPQGATKPNVPKLATPDDQEGDDGILSPSTEEQKGDQEAEVQDGSTNYVKKPTLDTALKIPLPKSQGSLLSPGAGDSSDFVSDSDVTSSGKLLPPRSSSIPKSPDSMPIPALPKRAAGPRRKKSGKDLKSAKSTQELDESSNSVVPIISGDSEAPKDPEATSSAPAPAESLSAEAGAEAAEAKTSDTDATSSELKPEGTEDLLSAAPSEAGAATPPPPSPSVLATEGETEGEETEESESPHRRPTIEIPPQSQEVEAQDDEHDYGLPTPRPKIEQDSSMQPSGRGIAHDATLTGVETTSTPESKEEAPEVEVQEQSEEEEEAARKRQLAEKMARLGAVNPFSPGGFVSPISPSGRSQVVGSPVEETKVQEGEDVDDIDTVPKQDNVIQKEPAHESESNVSVLSSLPSLRVPADRVQESDYSHTYTHEASNDDAARQQIPEEPETSNENSNMVNHEDNEVEDLDVDYPMLSPVVAAEATRVPFSPTLEDVGEAGPRGMGEEASGLAHADESDISIGLKANPLNEGLGPNPLEPQDPDSDYDQDPLASEKYQEETEDMPSKRITRTVPPPPTARQFSPSASPDRGLSPIRSNSYSPNRASLASALSRKAPPPPRSSSSLSNTPNRRESISPSPPPPPRSTSPTPSPPHRPFVREGAPSPPSLRAYSAVEDEEYGSNSSFASGELDQKENQTPELTHENESTVLAPSGSSKSSPPPIPPNRPPIPHVRRAIPPPPSGTPPLRPPPVEITPQDLVPPASKQSLLVIPNSPEGGDDEVEYQPNTIEIERREKPTSTPKEQETVRRAANRPGLSPPRQKEGDSHSGKEREVMHDEEGDPVDPSFVGSRKPPPQPIIPRRSGSQDKEAESNVHSEPEETEEDPEAARRRTIAERMAKLGGIRFGMPVPARPPPAARRTPEQSGEPEQSTSASSEQADPEQNSEEAERTRRAGIAARMAAMGGRGFGMYGGAVPTAAPILSSSQPSAPTSKPPTAPLAAPPPVPGSRLKRMSQGDVAGAIGRAPPPPPPPPPVMNASSYGTSGDTSESEVELVSPATEEEGEIVDEEVEEPEIVETPPAPPSRTSRPPIPHVNRAPPPIPVQEEGQNTSPPPPLPSGRRPPARAAPVPVPPPSSDHVVLGDEGSNPQSTYPSRTSSRPPLAPVVEPSAPPSLESSGQWELPNIPKMSLDLNNYGTTNTTADQSWTEVEEQDLPPKPSTSTPAPAPATTAAASASASASASTSSKQSAFSGPSPNPVSSDMLYYLSQTLGPKVLSSAQNLHEKSKRLAVGDGSSASFLLTVLSTINASTTSLGHLIYAQNGGTIQKRIGDIMPGDVIALYAANFKGHKGGLGLGGGYSAFYGGKDDPVLGVVCEFEAKKSKIRAFAVNQHPNVYPTIDTPSYKLDDLKSGVVKVFRVAEKSR